MPMEAHVGFHSERLEFDILPGGDLVDSVRDGPENWQRFVQAWDAPATT